MMTGQVGLSQPFSGGTAGAVFSTVELFIEKKSARPILRIAGSSVENSKIIFVESEVQKEQQPKKALEGGIIDAVRSALTSDQAKPSILSDPEVMSAIMLASLPTYEGDDWLNHARDRLRALKQLPNDWDGYEAEAPSEASILVANDFLKVLATVKLNPTRIVASAAGGIGITVRVGKNSFAVESLNTGTFLYELRLNGAKQFNLMPESFDAQVEFVKKVKSELG